MPNTMYMGSSYNTIAVEVYTSMDEVYTPTASLRRRDVCFDFVLSVYDAPHVRIYPRY